jgi:hypothetical protein
MMKHFSLEKINTLHFSKKNMVKLKAQFHYSIGFQVENRKKNNFLGGLLAGVSPTIAMSYVISTLNTTKLHCGGNISWRTMTIDIPFRLLRVPRSIITSQNNAD